jgi:uncharacterized protein (DUF1499 family)
LSLWYVPSALVVLLGGGGVLGAHTGSLEPETGYRWFSWGMGIAAVSLVPLVFALLLEPLRGAATRALLVPLLALFTGVAPSLSALNAPAIHDITTDPADTLLFSPDVVGLEPGRAEVLAEQKRAYPDIAPLQVLTPAAEAFQHAAEVARAMPRWRVTSVDAVRSRIQAHETSPVFRFRDDVVIRVSALSQGDGAPRGGGSRIDVRSRSRSGLSDRGVNAARIRAYLAAYKAGGFR